MRSSGLAERLRRRWYGPVLFLALLVALPRLATVILTNAGSLALARTAVFLEETGPGERRTRLLARASAWFEQALTLNDDYPAARWGLGRAALALGGLGTQEDRHHTAAADALRPLVIGGTDNPLLSQDALIAFSHSGQPEDVIALYEANLPVVQVRPISDTVALAYMRRSAPGDLARARAWRPGDLYVNYHLWQAARDAGDIGAAATYSRTLAYFPLEAVNPTARRLLDYAVEVIPSLLDEELWDRDKTLNTVSFLVWQHNGAVGVERLLEQLVECHPADPDWLFYLAEHYHRRGDLDQAEAVYRQVQALEPAYAQAYLRLGMVAEARSQVSSLSSQAPISRSQEQLKDAARWYGQYHALVPDDLLGLKRLAEVCTALEQAGEDNESCRQAALRVSGLASQVKGEHETLNLRLETSPAAALQDTLEARADDRHIVAELLGLPTENVKLGENLLENGGFEEWVGERPESWTWSAMYGREPFNAAAFTGGSDKLLAFEEQRAARVTGFWVQYQQEKQTARAGFWHASGTEKALQPIMLKPGVPYVFSFYYQTTRVPEGKAAVWVSRDPDVLWGSNRPLPATDGKWFQFVAVGWHRSDIETAIRPLLRSFSPGCVRFDQVELRPINLPEQAVLNTGGTQFLVIGKDR